MARRLPIVAAVGLLLACRVSPPLREVQVDPSAATWPFEPGVAPPAQRAVLEAPAPPPSARSPFAYANVDPVDDFVVGPPEARPACEEELEAAGVTFKAATLPFRMKQNAIRCGASQVVVYRGSLAAISYQPSVTTTCAMALALARFETIVQEEALRTFGARVVKIHHIGTYACRGMASDPKWVSEHAYANAIDLTDFVLEDGRAIDVLKHFRPSVARTTKPKSTFLRQIAMRAYDEETFSSVLTPFFDRHHVGHFHLDLARFRSDGTRMMGGLPPLLSASPGS